MLLSQTMSNNNDRKLDKRIERYRSRLSLCPSWTPNLLRFRLLMDLSNALYDRFEQLGGIEYLDESITSYRQMINLSAIGSSDHIMCLNNLAVFVGSRFDELGRMEDLEEQIACHRQVLALLPQGHRDRSTFFNNLAVALCTRFDQLGKMEDLDEAITYHRQGLSLALRAHGHSDRSNSLSNLANTLNICFGQLGRMEDLEEAITYHRQALALRHHGHPDRSYSLFGLAIAVLTRFDQLGMMEDLEEAITCHREALVLRPPGHPRRPSSLSNLATAFSTRFDQLGRMEDLEEAMAYYREALALRPPGHPHISALLDNLASVFSTRFDQLGKIEDLEEAITYHRQALALEPNNYPYRASSLNSLAANVCTRFNQLGRMEDLEEAITCHRQSLALLPHGHPDHHIFLNSLGRTVSTRFRHLRRMEDLEEAVTCFRQALALQPHGPIYSTSLNNLAYAMTMRFDQLNSMDDLDEAISCHRQGLALKPDSHPNRASSLDNLASALSIRFEHLGKLEDLEEAISCYCQALALRPRGHPDRSSTLHNFATTMSTRFQQSGNKDDLLDAAKYVSEARDLLPTSHPYQSTFGFHLAFILLIQCDIVELDESRHMMIKAFELFEHAANHSPASARDRFDAAVRWAREAHLREHQSVVNAYTKSLTLLDRRLVLAPTIESQQSLLAIVPKALALDAASSSIDRGEFRSAIELLEHGRAVLWSKLRGYRHPLDKLRTIDKELFDQFETLSGQLECLAMSVESGLSASSSESKSEQPLGSSFEAKMQQHRILSEKWDDVVDKIRRVDGFTDFLRAIPFAILQTAAAEGPIIIINISRYRSDAIILQDVGDPVIVPLPNTLPTTLVQLSSQFATACASHGKDSARLILPILRSLWDNIAFPVRTQLIALGVPDKSRIWLCPTSILCGLPLHAAGIYSSKVPKPNSIPDCYISSYTPSLSALIKARSGLVARTTNPNVLVIA